jgi:hypothetical protein
MILLIVGGVAVVLVITSAVVYFLLTNDTGQHAGPPAPAHPAPHMTVRENLAAYGIRVPELHHDEYLPAPPSEAPTIVPTGRSPLTLDLVAAIARRADEIATVRRARLDDYLGDLDRATRYEHSDETDSFAAIASGWFRPGVVATYTDDTDDPDNDGFDAAPLDYPFTPPPEWYRELADAPLDAPLAGGVR